jgi:hypothetical protein
VTLPPFPEREKGIYFSSVNVGILPLSKEGVVALNKRETKRETGTGKDEENRKVAF